MNTTSGIMTLLVAVRYAGKDGTLLSCFLAYRNLNSWFIL
jgi:hypothetical protein